eukprot:1148820-Pelagomonas_calceolata.AAC.3
MYAPFLHPKFQDSLVNLRNCSFMICKSSLTFVSSLCGAALTFTSFLTEASRSGHNAPGLQERSECMHCTKGSFAGLFISHAEDDEVVMTEAGISLLTKILHRNLQSCAEDDEVDMAEPEEEEEEELDRNIVMVGFGSGMPVEIANNASV